MSFSSMMTCYNTPEKITKKKRVDKYNLTKILISDLQNIPQGNKGVSKVDHVK